MKDRDRSDAPTALERPGGSAPADSLPPTEPSVSPTASEVATSAFDPPGDRFETRTELGRGGMGRVDEAFDRALGRPVAIKHMLSPSGIALARFEREARITARLEHPGIVPIHDAGRAADGTPYYVMRRVDGLPLSEVAGGKTLDERLALVPNLLAACDAAAFAHARSIVHRDIKPTNILIGPFGETLLIDWGLARDVSEKATDEQPIVPSEPELTRVGTVAGTPGFMSPEQARGETVDARADVFALGVTLFYVLAGELPWATASATEMVNAVGAGRAPAWDRLSREVPVDLRAVLEKAMASEVSERYADAGALAADLRRFITGNLVGAHEYGPFARFVRFVRRHRAAALVALVSLVVVAVVATISVRRVIAERDDANAARALAERRHREAVDIADGLLVDTARQLAMTDPIAAIAKLRKLAPTSRRWPEAWAAATTAWFRGIPFGFVSDVGPARVQVAADSRYALNANLRTGSVVVMDLVSRTRRTVATLEGIFRCTWLATNQSIVCSQVGKIAIIDVPTATVREVPVNVASLHGDLSSRVLVHTADKRVLELRAGAQDLVEIMRDVDDLTASPDLEWLVIRRAGSLELVHGKRAWPIPTDSNSDQHPAIVVRDGLVTMLRLEEVVSLQVVGDQLIKRAVIPRRDIVHGLASTGGQSHVLDSNGVSLVHPRGAISVKRVTIKSIFYTARGFAITSDKGEIILRDLDGWFELGPRPHSYDAVDQSPDGRFVIAAASGGDVLVWDLGDSRGHTISLDSAQTLGQITATDLWMFEPGEGVHRHDLRTGADELVVKSITPMARFEIDPRGRWVSVTEDVGTERLTRIYDVLHDSTFDMPAAATNVAADDGGLGFALHDRTLWRWIPGSNRKPHQIGTLPHLPVFIAIAPKFVLAVAGDRTVMRFHTVDGRVEQLEVPGDVSEVVIEHEGRGWILANGVVWRWDLAAAAPMRVPTDEPIKQIIALESGVLLQSTKAMTLVQGDSRRLVSAVSGEFRLMNKDLIAIHAATNVVSLVDLNTAQHVDLPQLTVNTRSLVAAGNYVGMLTGLHDSRWRFTYWNVSVPREPEALQRWLATITNAKPIADSDAVAWPAD